MNARRQYQVLYRDFLFRIVDRELLSSYAKGDASQLLLQILTLLLCVSVLFSVPALFVDPGLHPQARLFFAWNVEHFLIATTMLAVGVLAVLGWGQLFPEPRDIHVLAPLPVRGGTILLAKIAAIGTALAATVAALHVVASVSWSARLNAPPRPYTIPSLTSERALPPVGAADLPTVLDRDFAAAVRAGLLAPGGGGVAIAVSTHGTRRILAYGGATSESIFPIASIGKLFTGLALAHLIEDGTVAADEPVRALIPDAGLRPPAGGQRDITPIDLVTHRSGLPPMPVEFRRDPDNPFAGFDVARLYTFLAARGAGRPRDPGFRYSNVGFGLLGHALATRAGVDYETLIRELITGPLGMTDTAVGLTAAQERRLLRGHDTEHVRAPIWAVGSGLLGAGALKSTAPDLLAWIEAYLHPERLPAGTLRRAIEVSQRRLAAVGADGGIAFGWLITPRGELLHSGDIAGFSAQVWLDPALQRGLAVLANTQRGTSISADVISQHVLARLDGRAPVALAEVTIPARAGAGGWLRLFAAYWLTMLAAAMFVVGAIVGLQGAAAAMLPHRTFQRVSSLLQFGVFCALVWGYFFQPIGVMPMLLVDAQAAGPLGSSPSLWFLGLFQALSGSPALAPLARTATAGLAVAVIGAAGACALSYVRTLRSMAEHPDIAPAVHVVRRLPAAGRALNTAVVHFAARTLFRSPPHRIIYTFHLGIGIGLSAVLMKAPRDQRLAEDISVAGWTDTSEALIVASVVMMVCAVVGARLTFAMPRDLAANWIFRILPVRGGAAYVSARRRVLLAIAAAPVWVLAAGVFLVQWPWVQAFGHLIVLAFVGAILVELCLSGTQGIPFTCAYLPGQSRSHLSAPAAVVSLLLLILVVADSERRALQDGRRFGIVIAVLAVLWIAARVRTSWMANVPAPEFEDEPGDRLQSLDLWDVRSGA
jgi:CubicO group peptidase (beta-lactamase class C family)